MLHYYVLWLHLHWINGWVHGLSLTELILCIIRTSVYNVHYFSVLAICESWHFTQFGRHFHDRIISLDGEIWVHIDSLAPSVFFYILKFLYQARKVSGHCLCARCVDWASFYFFYWALELLWQCGIFCVSFSRKFRFQ